MTRASWMRILAASSLALASGCKGKACDAELAETLGAELNHADPRERGELVRTELAKVCKLPDSVAGYLQHFGPGPARLLPPDADIAEMRAALDRACPGYEAIFASSEELDAHERAVHRYDQCGFARHELIERDAYLRHFYSDVPWAIHQWMLDQGLTPAQAKPLAQALFSLENEQSSGIDLPEGVQLPIIAAPLRELPRQGLDPTVYITREHMLFASRPVAVSSDGWLARTEARNHQIPELGEPLDEELGKSRLVSESLGQAWRSRVNIAADARVPWAPVFDAMYTASTLDVQELGLIVEIGPHDFVALPLDQRFSKIDPVLETGYFAGEGYTVLSEPRASFGDALADFADAVAERCTDCPSPGTASFSASWDTPVAVVVDGVIALRGPACADQPHAGCRFARVTLLAPPK